MSNSIAPGSARDFDFSCLPPILLPWYRDHARPLPWRRDTEPDHVWVSEIMLQQTRAEAVCKYYTRFLESLPSIKALADAPEDELLKLWEGLGYYSRARNLQKAARQIQEQYGGVFPDTIEAIRGLPGIGPYTAGAIASICFGLPVAAVDGNVLRIITRMTEDDSPIDLMQTKTKIAASLEAVYPCSACGDFTQALMELGATICTPKSPKCAVCPVEARCGAFQNQTVLNFPVKLPKREKRLEYKTLFLLWCGDKIALTKRSDAGLLSNLWQLPNLNGRLTSEEALSAAAEFGVSPTELCKEIHKVHLFTHIRWEMTCYYLQCANPAPAFTWVSPEEIQTRYPLPTAFRMFLENGLLD